MNDGDFDLRQTTSESSDGHNPLKRETMKAVMRLSEDIVFLAWGVFSIAAGIVLILHPSLTGKLAEIGSLVIERVAIFRSMSVNHSFNTQLSQAHFFMILCGFPFQVLSFAIIPNAGIASGVQNKSETGIYWLIVLFLLPVLAMLAVGPVAPRRYIGLFGGTVFVVIFNYIIFISMAYLSRIGLLIATTKFSRSDK